MFNSFYFVHVVFAFCIVTTWQTHTLHVMSSCSSYYRWLASVFKKALTACIASRRRSFGCVVKACVTFASQALEKRKTERYWWCFFCFVHFFLRVLLSHTCVFVSSGMVLTSSFFSQSFIRSSVVVFWASHFHANRTYHFMLPRT